MSRAAIVRSLLVTALFLAGCDDREAGPSQVRENAFVWSGHAKAGSTLHVRDFAGDITVQPSADDTVRVTAQLEWRGQDAERQVRFTGSIVGDDVLICAIWGDGQCSIADYKANFKGRGGMRAKANFTVQVPAGVKLSLSNISGDIKAASSAQVEATTMDGDVLVVTAVGPVRGETLNGSVDIRMSSLAAGSDSVVAKTLNGDAFIYLSSLSDARVDLSVMNGDVSSAFADPAAAPAEKRRIAFSVGTGARAVVAHVLNGDAALRSLDAQGRAP